MKAVYDRKNGPKGFKWCLEGDKGQALGWIADKETARLLAAAPDMLVALRMMVWNLDSEELSQPIPAEAMSAIKKAETGR